MSDLTEVELYWHRGRVERWIRFGSFAHERIIDRRRRVVGFSPGSVFAYVRWAANEHGTIASRIDILRAALPGAPISTVPGVAPGGEILLRLAELAESPEGAASDRHHRSARHRSKGCRTGSLEPCP